MTLIVELIFSFLSIQYYLTPIFAVYITHVKLMISFGIVNTMLNTRIVSERENLSFFRENQNEGVVPGISQSASTFLLQQDNSYDNGIPMC